MRTIGAEMSRVEPGEVKIVHLTQQHGYLHTAVVTAIVDTCGYAMALAAPGKGVLTVEYKANFLSPAAGDRMRARARGWRSANSFVPGQLTSGVEAVPAAYAAEVAADRRWAHKPSSETSRRPVGAGDNFRIGS